MFITIPLLEDQFVDMTFMTRFTGLTDKWFYKLIQDGEFPRPIKFGRSSRWLKSEVEAWAQVRIQQSRQTKMPVCLTYVACHYTEGQAKNRSCPL